MNPISSLFIPKFATFALQSNSPPAIGVWRLIRAGTPHPKDLEAQQFLQVIRLWIDNDGKFSLGPSTKQKDMMWHGTWLRRKGTKSTGLGAGAVGSP